MNAGYYSDKKPAQLAWRGDSIGYSDGGFRYNHDCLQSDMGIPGTEAAPNQSTTFATWFRVHTLPLTAEILTDEEELNVPFRFTSVLSIGWHQLWNRSAAFLSRAGRLLETGATLRLSARRMKRISRNAGVRALRAIPSPRTVVRHLPPRL
jgi:hypothetical protein